MSTRSGEPRRRTYKLGEVVLNALRVGAQCVLDFVGLTGLAEYLARVSTGAN